MTTFEIDLPKLDDIHSRLGSIESSLSKPAATVDHSADFDNIQSALKGIQSSLGSQTPPADYKSDFSSIQSALKALSSQKPAADHSKDFASIQSTLQSLSSRKPAAAVDHSEDLSSIQSTLQSIQSSLSSQNASAGVDVVDHSAELAEIKSMLANLPKGGGGGGSSGGGGGGAGINRILKKLREADVRRTNKLLGIDGRGAKGETNGASDEILHKLIASNVCEGLGVDGEGISGCGRTRRNIRRGYKINGQKWPVIYDELIADVPVCKGYFEPAREASTGATLGAMSSGCAQAILEKAQACIDDGSSPPMFVAGEQVSGLDLQAQCTALKSTAAKGWMRGQFLLSIAEFGLCEGDEACQMQSVQQARMYQPDECKGMELKGGQLVLPDECKTYLQETLKSNAKSCDAHFGKMYGASCSDLVSSLF